MAAFGVMGNFVLAVLCDATTLLLPLINKLPDGGDALGEHQFLLSSVHTDQQQGEVVIKLAVETFLLLEDSFRNTFNN